MLIPTPIRPHRRRSEEGYILVMVMFMLAILVISMSLAVPVVKKAIQRDRDVETMHRGKQYVRAIKMYYTKFGAYPPNIDALVKTNEIRFLRKKYIDPTSGKAEWKIIRFGQNKTQTLGFFGQPIGGSTIAGTGPGGNGFNPSPGMPGSPQSGGPNPNLPNQNPNGTPGSPGDPNNPTDPNAPGGGSTGGQGTGLTGQTFGGAGMIGVSPTSPKQSILVYKKKNHYNEWEFFYDPVAEQMMAQGGGNIGNSGLPTNPGGSGANPAGGGPQPVPPPPPQQ